MSNVKKSISRFERSNLNLSGKHQLTERSDSSASHTLHCLSQVTRYANRTKFPQSPALTVDAYNQDGVFKVRIHDLEDAQQFVSLCSSFENQIGAITFKKLAQVENNVYKFVRGISTASVSKDKDFPSDWTIADVVTVINGLENYPSFQEESTFIRYKIPGIILRYGSAVYDEHTC
jgi:hypothetical protein